MQIFRLPWSSEQIGPKDSMFKDQRLSPMVEIPVLNKLKRKRAASTEVTSPPRVLLEKKRRPEDIVRPASPSVNISPLAKTADQQTFTNESEARSANSAPHDIVAMGSLNSSSTDTSTGPLPVNFAQQPETSESMSISADVAMSDAQQATSADVTSLSKAQQVIETEFNMQILMKHNELRLIEQELAKCQVALEQLRRCEVRPYPGSNDVSELVSSGTGASILPPFGYTRASNPAPHGVTDGPYTRHYQRWLLQDAQFDSMPIQYAGNDEGFGPSLGRPTRNSGSVRKSVSKPFVFPGRSTEALHSIPNYPAPAPKDRSSPLILRRSTDKQLVKLICNNCLRGNFSSIQGFLNHCRIAHKVDYKSHDAAAVDCGRTLDEAEAASLPPETQNTPVSKPSISRVSTATSTPFRSLVHPLNTTGGTLLASSGKPKASTRPKIPVQNLQVGGPCSAGSPLTPSPALPRLSAQLAKHRYGGDLAAAATSAREKVDLGTEDDLLSPDALDHSSPVEMIPGARSMPGNDKGKRTVLGAPRPSSSKGFSKLQQRPRPSPLAPTPAGVDNIQHSEIPESPQYQGPNFSPHTADSNPGLVSDHEDDDHGSASEEEAPHAEMRRPFTVGRTCSDNMEIVVAEDDDIDRDGVIIRRHSLFADDAQGLSRANVSKPSKKFGGCK